MKNGILDHLPYDRIESSFSRAGGNEIETGKLSSRESSAALAANMLGIFYTAPEKFPPLPGTSGWGWPAHFFEIEFQAPFPWWPAGRHPWLDAALITDNHLIGIEAKRYEPFRASKPAEFSDAYWRDVWGAEMGPFLAMRDSLRESPERFRHLDAAQLVKHAFGLRTIAARKQLRPALVYMYAEPGNWADGRPVSAESIARHRTEIEEFAAAVADAEVEFYYLSYRRFHDLLHDGGDPLLQHHVAAVNAWCLDY